MRMKVQVIIESDNGQTEVVQDVVALDRGPLQPEELGLTLAEAKDILLGVQQTMVTRQVEEYAEQSCCCSLCGKSRPRKGKHEIVYRTLFGKLRLNSPRYYGDRCRHGETISTAFVESTVNYVVSKRMVKKQQMRWSQRGAHLSFAKTNSIDVTFQCNIQVTVTSNEHKLLICLQTKFSVGTGC